VWWARSSHSGGDGLVRLLDQTERRRLARYRRIEDGDRFLVGCALAKTALSGYLGCEAREIRFERACPNCGGPHGKPQVKDTGLEFSVSHSGGLVVVAVAQSPVGVDVEQIRGELSSELVTAAMADSEAAALAAMAPHRRLSCFLTAWTQKEAVAKATGAGIDLNLEDVVVFPSDPPRLMAWPRSDSPQKVALFTQTASRYTASLAVIGTCETVHAFDGSSLIAGPRAGTKRLRQPATADAGMPAPFEPP
jgi:4'-phosphopantetheinyl transferase